MHFGIIAAGEGSRLAGEGVAVPKPLLPLGGVPMIERLIRIFEDCGAESVSVVVNGFMTEVKDFLDRLTLKNGDKVNVRVKTTPSSMHTFFELMSMLEGKGRFIATTVDTIFREDDFRKYVEAYSRVPEEVAGMMAVTDFIEDEKPLYVEIGPENRITGFLDKPSDTTRFVSGGIYGLDGRAGIILDRCMAEGVHRMRNFQRRLIEDGLCLEAYPMGKVIDVDHVGDIERAEEFLRQ